MKHKYSNRPVNGYHSSKESRRAQELHILQQVGAISDLKEQVTYELIPKQDGERAVTYICDFQYVEDGKLVVEDVKSAMTKKLPAYVIKRKLLKHVHGISIRET